MIDPASSRTGMMGNKNNGMMHVKVCDRDSRKKAGMDVGVGKKECRNTHPGTCSCYCTSRCFRASSIGLGGHEIIHTCDRLSFPCSVTSRPLTFGACSAKAQQRILHRLRTMV
jgi:hypothetical protein